ncbi:Coronin-B [Thelohanellus kitauei]|uniref:Coronin-B n=1 Tax=Thelohanellus kitauei TaxID=669202 RepID=A0A0C2IZ45_THEKT|nr:Coronin-B [Thelohanellus kitauei]
MSVSVFKNAVPQLPKDDKTCAELPISSLDITYGSSIACNTEYIYIALGGGDVGVVPLFEFGKKRFLLPKLKASPNTLLSIAATYLDSSIFATIAQDDLVKVWRKTSEKDPYYSLASQIRKEGVEKIKNIAFNPCCSRILASVSDFIINIVDIEKPDRSLVPLRPGNFTNLSWKDDGSLIAVVSDVSTFS